MALFVKQDFTPPILSKKWIAIKCRPNMLLQSRAHVISILESGLMFREDSARVEQEAPAADELWAQAGGGSTGWLTRGERVLSVLTVGAAVAAIPPKIHGSYRMILLQLTSYAVLPLTIRIGHRLLARGPALSSLLDYMRDYLALARRSMACVKEYKLLHKGLGSISTMLESTLTLLWRQQTELALLMARSSSALLGNFPWLYEDVDWEALWKVSRESAVPTESDLVKVHHAFLVIQSTLLKHIAMAHFLQPSHLRGRYVNHNERIYWLHNELLARLKSEFKESFESLDRMYRLLKNYGTNDFSMFKKSGVRINDAWLYSDVHGGVARATVELKVALNKSTKLDMFLDSCAINRQELNLDVLNKDIDDLIDDITKCLNTMQSSQLRLKKLQSKFVANVIKDIVVEDREFDYDEDSREVVKIGDAEPEAKDEVFFFVKTEDDDERKVEIAGDITGPGRREREATKVVLKELKRKLVKREDVMRERERRALVATMPELRDVPEFPRQNESEEVCEKRGYISKILRLKPNKLFKCYKIRHVREKDVFRNKKIEQQRKKYSDLSEIGDYFEITSKSKLVPKEIISVEYNFDTVKVIKWLKIVEDNEINCDSSGMSECLSDIEMKVVNEGIKEVLNIFNKNKSEAKSFTFTKKDLELSPSSSESDYDEKDRQMPLQDVRRHRVARRKNYPTKRGSLTLDNNVDESLKPIEYSFGAGLAMASVLQAKSVGLVADMGLEEVFIGDGEVSDDSGNEEDP